jgi:ribA/ribD-fused uncharacterized protein
MNQQFEGRLDFCSNFFVEPDGTTVEHEFQAAKTNDLLEKTLILSAPTPGKAKRQGRKATLRADWTPTIRINEMRSLVFRKFFDHNELTERLLATGSEELIEWNTWHDQFWGICQCGTCPQQEGLNHLGRILMEVRDFIASFGK